MNNPKKTSNNIPKHIGLGILLISVMVVMYPQVFNTPFLNNFFSGPFLITYFLSIGYFGFILLRHIILNGWNIFKIDGDLIRIFVLLFTFSGFTLNLNMNMFAEPTFWLKIYLIIILIAIILFMYKTKLPENINYFIYFAFGMGFIIAAYFSVVLLPMAAFGIAFFWIFGISLHGLIPLIWLTVFSFLFFLTKNIKFKYSFISGAVIPLFAAMFFMIQWNKIQSTIEEYKDDKNKDLPQWLILSQKLNDDTYTSWALKSGLINETRTSWGNFDPWMNGSFNDVKKHDPLTMICRQFSGDLGIEQEVQVKILETKFKYRHEAIPRFWSGNHLTTNDINTDVKLMPGFRVAYTEKTLTIENKNNDSWWRPDEEAIYTFYMPEGSIVTSLSLWINGVEEKARLSTKEKADSAYETIVGYEQRDPSLVTWQEGNKVVVRVFPCSPDSTRKFKIGFSSPLKVQNNDLVLNNIYFEGPDFQDSKEEIIISLDKVNKDLQISLPGFFNKTHDSYNYKGHYRKNWEVTIPKIDLSSGFFSFNNKSFHVEDISTDDISFNPENIYLDINSSWSESDFNQIWNIIKNKKVYIFTDEITLLNEENKDLYFSQLHQLNFSLFPVYLINYTENSLIISNSSSDTPCLSDLEPSGFYTKTYEFLEELKNPVYFFNIGKNNTTYIKTLLESGVFNQQEGTVEELNEIITKEIFPVKKEAENTAIIDLSEMQIVCDTVYKGGNAPDILMRMFAYNQILKKAGHNHFNEDLINSELFSVAKEAHIVTPISSLIVLETQNDYERFDIDEPATGTSLNNAFNESYGAVPEPHEWALIIMSILVAVFLFIKRIKLF
ncbi:MAG: XrtN system VIT domain-containing protein [Bacteroidota bacterium]